MPTTLIDSTEIRARRILIIDDEAANVLLLASVLERFLARYASINTFTELRSQLDLTVGLGQHADVSFGGMVARRPP